MLANSDSSSSLLPGTTPMPSAVTIPDSLFSYSPRSTVNHESSNVSPPQCLCHSSCNGQYQHTLRFPDISGSRSPTPSLPSTESSLSNNPSSINIGVSDNTTGLTTDIKSSVNSSCNRGHTESIPSSSLALTSRPLHITNSQRVRSRVSREITLARLATSRSTRATHRSGRCCNCNGVSARCSR